MIHARLLAAAVGLLFAGTAAAQDPQGPWIGMMRYGDGVVGRQAGPAVAVDGGFEAQVIIAWKATLPDDGGDYLLGRFRVDCETRMASAMEARTMSLTRGELSRQARETPNWAEAPEDTPGAALIRALCDDVVTPDGPVWTTDAAFVESARRKLPAP